MLSLLDKFSRKEENVLQVAPKLSRNNMTPRISLDMWEGGLVGMGFVQELYVRRKHYGNRRLGE